MKRLLLFGFLLLAGVLSVKAQGKEWTDPEINEVNRLPMHTNFFAYASMEEATEGVKEKSSNFMTLNGNWKFNWVKDADCRPIDFYREDFNDKGWDTMTVPGMWEMKGYGDPIYVNMGYAWRNQYWSNPPLVPERNNHVGSYRREIVVPAAWKGKRIIAHFGSVTSNMYLWVNGRYVGYSEDSKLEAEFDLTSYLHPGEKNLIAFQVFRWCDGTYLEDQDFFRYTGVARDCFLFVRNADYVRNIRVTPDLDSDYRDGSLQVDIDLEGRGTVEIQLSDKAGNKVASDVLDGKGLQSTVLHVGNPDKWTAETPNLYALTIMLKSRGRILEVIPLRVGFRKIEQKNGQILINGKAVLFKGVNRHEIDPDNGYIVSPSQMIREMREMKRLNVNAVRASHYPQNNLWYDLCDEYGFYVVAEANIESHGLMYDDKRTLAKNTAYTKAHIERNRRNVYRDYNHPSIIFWSLGNEAGMGVNFEKCYEWVKNADKTRPVQYQQARISPFTDVYCPMYQDYEACEKYLKEHKDKPLIQCEYAHAMGNSLGGFKEYWDLIRKEPNYQGGFIWDFKDQSNHWKNKKGISIYGYGGDFNKYDGTNSNFCDNGLLSPDCVWNPHAYEAAYFHQSIWTTPVNLPEGEIKVFNEYFFRDLSAYYMEWELLADGERVQAGIVGELDVAPQQTAVVKLPLQLLELPDDKELLLNVRYKLKSGEFLREAGEVVAYDQLVISDYPFSPQNVRNAMWVNMETPFPVIDNTDHVYLTVSGDNFLMEFNKKSGYLCRYEVNGQPLLEEGSELVPNFWRAPTDNDFGAGFPWRLAVWKHPELNLKSCKHSLEDSLAVVRCEYEMSAVGGKLSLVYRINNVGAVQVTQKMTVEDKSKKVPDMFRFGMRLRMPSSFDRIEYYGRGPIENYADRKSSMLIGKYKQTVEEQFYPYIRPQETGTKSDIRWWKMMNISGSGLMFAADAPFSASALNYTIEALDDGLSKKQSHSTELVPAGFTNFCIDKVQLGLGCINSWSAWPIKKYRVPYQDYEFNFVMLPLDRAF